MTKILTTWSWLSIIFAVVGTFLLYPIGNMVLNSLFVVIKVGMIAGLIMLLFQRRKLGFYIWVLLSIAAVIMTVIKWDIVGRVSILFIVSIIVDVCMPTVAYILIKNKRI